MLGYFAVTSITYMVIETGVGRGNVSLIRHLNCKWMNACGHSRNFHRASTGNAINITPKHDFAMQRRTKSRSQSSGSEFSVTISYFLLNVIDSFFLGSPLQCVESVQEYLRASWDP